MHLIADVQEKASLFKQKDVLGMALIIYWSWNQDDHGVRWGQLGSILH